MITVKKNKLSKSYKRALIILSVLVLVGLVESGAIIWKASHSPKTNTSPASALDNSNKADKNAETQALAYSINDPASIWVVVNKGRILPADYAPESLVAPKVSLSQGAASDNMHLRQDAAAAVEKLLSAAGSEGVKLMLVSGYRSYGTQQSVYNGYVSSQGRAYADATSAQPGHSEHQTGLAADLGVQNRKCQLEACFGNTPEGQWLAANAHKYGFVVRYQKDKENLTGYEYEPWHMRYVGKELAAKLYSSGQTMEQYFSLPTFQTYPAQLVELKS